MLGKIKEKITRLSPRTRRWGVRGLAVLSAVSVLTSGMLTASAEAISVEFADFTLKEACLWSCDTNATLTKKLFEKPTSWSTADGYDTIRFEYGYSGNEKFDYFNGWYAAVMGLKIRPQSSNYGLSFDIYWNYPSYMSYAAITTTSGRSVMAKAQAITERGKMNIACNSEGMYGYRYTFPVDDYGDYLSLNLVCCLPGDWNGKVEFYVFNQFEYEYGPNASFDIEENKANEGGSSASDEATSAIPSVDSGFSEALKGFVSSMSYDGIEAKLPIPRVYIPAVGGMTEDIELLSEQEYDLSAAINQFCPKTLLELIRHLMTIALVLYCVYELYGLIQYVLTLKKGGKED